MCIGLGGDWEAGPKGFRGAPEDPPLAFPGLSGVSRRHPGPKTNESKKTPTTRIAAKDWRAARNS